MDSESLDRRVLECDIAFLCLSYLCHTCFHSSHLDKDRLFFAKSGYYSFQDYAMSKWATHTKTLIETCVSLFDDPLNGPHYRDMAAKTLGRFRHLYQAGLVAVDAAQAELAQDNTVMSNCQEFQRHDFYEHLDQIWKHVARHQKQGMKERNQVSIKELGKALEKSRTAIEATAPKLEESGESAKKFVDFYGSNYYKCTRVTCDYFYEGFGSKKALDHHSNRHERPYTCSYQGCFVAQFGFSSNKDRDKHIRLYHPDESDQQETFSQIGQEAVRDAKYQCDLCSKNYTRQAHLTAHTNSAHLGRRPYACTTCGRAFTRRNDRARHERSQHLRRA